ncbi:MAG: hypothetical protein ACOC83_07195, partial [Gemmatimonadota bacterium]
MQGEDEDADPAVRWLQGAFIAAETLGGPPGELDFMGSDVTAVRRTVLEARRATQEAREDAARLRKLVAHVTDLVTTV